MDESQATALFAKLSKLKVALVGEIILDEYSFVEPVGRATKDPVLVTHLQRTELYAGGILATARHLANFVEEVHVVSLVGDRNTSEEFIRASVPSNVKLTLLTRPNASTIIKRAYVDSVRNTKLFKVSQISSERLPDELVHRLEDAIHKEEQWANLVLVNDFGHEMIDERLAAVLEKTPKWLGINVQTNSANFGFNLVSKYSRADFVSMNQTEIKLFFHRKDRDYKDMFPDFTNYRQYKEVLLTLGKEGSLFFRTKVNSAPAFHTKPVDTIGAGDAAFGLTAVASYAGLPEEQVPVFTNAVGAAASLSIGNKDSVTQSAVRGFLTQKP